MNSINQTKNLDPYLAFHYYTPHIIIAVVYIRLYVYSFPVPRIVATALNI